MPSNNHDQIDARGTPDTIQPLCKERPFSKLVTRSRNEFVYCGLPLRRNAYLFRTECRPLIKFDREGLGVFKGAVSNRVTHELWTVYQRRQRNSPIRLLFRHQYDFGMELFGAIDISTPIQFRHSRYREIFAEVSRAAEYVTDSLANTINSLTGERSFYLQRRALSELLPDRELEPEDYNRVMEVLKAEHLQLDYFWAKQAEHAYLRYAAPDRPIQGVRLD